MHIPPALASGVERTRTIHLLSHTRTGQNPYVIAALTPELQRRIFSTEETITHAIVYLDASMIPLWTAVPNEYPMWYEKAPHEYII